MIVRGTVITKCTVDSPVLRIENSEGECALTVLEEDQHIFSNFRVGDRLIVSDQNVKTCIGEKESMERSEYARKYCSASAGGGGFVYNASMAVQMDRMSTLGDLSPTSYIDVYAVVLSCKPPIETRGTDFLFTLEIADETRRADLRVFIATLKDFEKFVPEGQASPGLDYRQEHNFSKAFQPGDIILARSVKLGHDDGTALIHRACNITRLWSVGAADRAQGGAEASRQRDYLVIQFLSQFYISRSAEKRLSRKGKVIAELENDMYFNVVGKVVYIEHGYMTTVCITDYTHNLLVPRTWRGKYETSMLLYIKIYGKHAEKARYIKIGDVCLFENVRINQINDYLVSHMSESKDGSISIVEDPMVLEELGECERRYEGKGRGEGASGGRSMHIRADSLNGRADGGLGSASGAGASDAPGKMNERAGDTKENAQNAVAESIKRFRVLDASEEFISNRGEFRGAGPAEPSQACFTKIENMKNPGIYFTDCKVMDYRVIHTEAGLCIQITICDDHEGSLVVTARQRLTRSLLSNGNFKKGAQLRCMVLRMDSSKNINFVVSAFFGNEGISEFIKYYCLEQ